MLEGLRGRGVQATFHYVPLHSSRAGHIIPIGPMSAPSPTTSAGVFSSHRPYHDTDETDQYEVIEAFLDVADSLDEVSASATPRFRHLPAAATACWCPRRCSLARPGAITLIVSQRYLDLDSFAPLAQLWTIWAVLAAGLTFSFQQWAAVHGVSRGDLFPAGRRSG